MFEITPYARGSRHLNSYDPFKAMEEFEKNFFGRQLPAFKTDIRENEQAYVLEAELPGFSKDDIQVEVKNGYLTICAEHRFESGDKNEKNDYIRRERSYGAFSRSFDLDGIDSDGITAYYRDGVLTLTLPKVAVKSEDGRLIEIR